MKTQSIGPFLGINNRLPDFALRINDKDNGKGDYLREADNVEITNSGSVVRRKAPELLQAMSGAHSIHENFFVRASVLYKATFAPYSETLVKVLASDGPMSYAVINGDTYYSNGLDSGRISAAGVYYPWALPTPAAPSVATSAGTLFKGWYQVAVGYLNNVTGEEGGVSASSNYHLTVDGGLVVTLPSAAPGATHLNVYVSTVNGSIPMLQTTVAIGTTTVSITSHTLGRESNQRYEDPLPAGTRIFEFNGRLCSVKGKDLFYSLPYRHGYYLPAENRVAFPSNVSVAVPNQGGVYVAADKTYFFAGKDIGAVEGVQDVLPYGAVANTEFKVPNKTIVGWFGEKGVVLADPRGEVQAVMSDNIDMVAPVYGFSIVLETRGHRRVVSCGWCLNLDNLAATTYSNWGVTSAHGGYGTKADGIYTLEGGTDPVAAYVDLGKQNFGVENLKRMPAVYLGVSSDKQMMLRVTTPDTTDHDYLARSSDNGLMVQRVDTGKGLRENYFGLKVYNTEGSDFTLASVSFVPLASNRRI